MKQNDFMSKMKAINESFSELSMKISQIAGFSGRYDFFLDESVADVLRPFYDQFFYFNSPTKIWRARVMAAALLGNTDKMRILLKDFKADSFSIYHAIIVSAMMGHSETFGNSSHLQCSIILISVL